MQKVQKKEKSEEVAWVSGFINWLSSDTICLLI